MASSKPESKLIKAAGAVAWRPGPDGRPEILLVHRRKYDDWSLPKGKVEPGEVLPVTAVREVLEEGGARLALGRRLDSVRYNVGGRPKRVHYWSASVASLDDRAVPNDEVDQVEWVAADRAAERISYNRDNGVVADFARLPAPDRPGDPAPARQGGGQVATGSAPTTAARSTTPAAPTPRPWPSCSRASAPAPGSSPRPPPAAWKPSARSPSSPAPSCGKSRPSTFTTIHPERTRPTPQRPLPPSCREADHGGRAHDLLRSPGEHPRPPGRRPGRPRPRPARARTPPPAAPWPASASSPSPSSPRSGTTPSPPPASGSST